METVYVAIAILGMTAILGMYLLTLILRSKSTPIAVAIIHGLLAVTALVLLIVYSVRNSAGPWTSIIIFLMAATGGIILGYRDITGQPVPKWLAIGHGLIAVVGFVLLLCFTFC